MSLSRSLMFLFFVIMCLWGVGTHASAKQGGVRLAYPDSSLDATMAIYIVAIDNFTYEPDDRNDSSVDTWDVYDGQFKFRDDCDGFAFALQRMVGAGSVFFAYLNTTRKKPFVDRATTPYNHGIFLYAGYLWDLSGKVYTIAAWERAGNVVAFELGDITPDMRPGSN